VTFIQSLSVGERKALKKLARRELGRVSERIHMVLLSARGYSVGQIAQIFETSEGTIREWLEHFEKEGVEGLRDRPRSGRPRKVDAVAQEVIETQVETPPSTLGYLFGFWTVLALCSHLAKNLGVTISPSSLRRAMHILEFRWLRPKLDMPKQDPKAHEKMEKILQRLFAAGKDTAILCLDECDLHLLPVLRAMWMRKGHQVRVPTPGQNRKRSIFGAMDLVTGRFIHGIFERRTAVDFIVFLEKLLTAYPDGQILVLLDNFSAHKAAVVKEWLRSHPRIELLYLPAYSGHKQNPVEKVWWRLKAVVAANRCHGSMSVLIEAAERFFAELTPEAVLRLAA
jgi:transposase